MPTQYQKPEDAVVIAQAAEVFAEGPEISPYPDGLMVGLPRDGATTQVLAKLSDIDYDVGWVNPTYLVASPTPPTAADYGLPSIPANAVWIQTT